MGSRSLRCFANPIKLSNTKFLAKELKENPEFYFAFPHLAPDDVNKWESKPLVNPNRESPFFSSLLH